MLLANDYLFYIFAAISLICGGGVVTVQNPIYAAFLLAGAMVSIAGLFVTLNATFIAGVQLIVYAGAVMVLFVMVLMLFDLKHEMKTFSKGLLSGFLKLVSCGTILGLLFSWILYTFSMDAAFHPISGDPSKAMETTKELSTALFTRYIFGFEVIGALLLMIAIGAVALSRISGGTHADE